MSYSRLHFDACLSVSQDEIWSHMHPVVTTDMATTLFSDTELHAAVVALDASSCLGDDGFTRQFLLRVLGCFAWPFATWFAVDI